MPCRQWKLPVGVAIPGGVMATPVHAQTVYGPGDLLIHPTSQTARKGEITPYLSHFTQRGDGQARSQWYPFYLSYGISDRLEAAAIYVHRDIGPLSDDAGGLFLRYKLLDQRAARPEVSLTGGYLRGGTLRYLSTSLTGTRRFPLGQRRFVHVHLGGLFARQASLRVPDRPTGAPIRMLASENGVSGFVGVGLDLTPRVRLVGEVGTRLQFDAQPSHAVGLQWRPGNGPQLSVGVVNLGISTRPRFFVGVGYPLGGRK